MRAVEKKKSMKSVSMGIKKKGKRACVKYGKRLKQFAQVLCKAAGGFS